ncbi:hypothetical protein A4H97_33845 [Niastella yeongjuensis]|uniref:Uncharacterized protein n=1 Tax=Niastella yeongjuensis TaxID=354355 RepID=A0A1V9EC31_9BACT|nr:hypothetical protein [Niastella yeongjuensis]OQP43611.1 hypothetical protein A4H97_33845 [Niastella yeongjuensis]SEP29020.1 hypothetical protein SAMN05660816_05071 [Niastella yeongjuensis]
MKWRLAPYEERIMRKLPAISMYENEYLKQKYRYPVWGVAEILKKGNDKLIKSEAFLHEMFFEFYWDQQCHKITDIDALEDWLVRYSYTEAELFGIKINAMEMLIEKEIAYRRVFRARFFDAMNRKYSQECFEKAVKTGISKPAYVVRNAFETTENWHPELFEDEGNFIKTVEGIINDYCKLENCKEITMSVDKPGY